MHVLAELEEVERKVSVEDGLVVVNIPLQKRTYKRWIKLCLMIIDDFSDRSS